MPPSPLPAGRDHRVDLIRGFALLFIFIDHIPNNSASAFTLHSFGFCDAADVFVFLAGFSATLAYGRVFEIAGFRAGLAKVIARCGTLYAVQVILLLITVASAALWSRSHVPADASTNVLLETGTLLRGFLLLALPLHLDILPLYILLLACFPVLWIGLRNQLGLTVAVSFAIYLLANMVHLNLPNVLDTAAVGTWTFDPFAWQFVFVLGAAMAIRLRRNPAGTARVSPMTQAVCWAYLAFAFVAKDAWHLWPAPLGADFPPALFGNPAKAFVSPWRLAHTLAVITLACSSPALNRVAMAGLLKPVTACGRHSLPIFAVGCVLDMVARFTFKRYGADLVPALTVNGAGVALLLALGSVLAARKAAGRRAAPDIGLGSDKAVEPAAT